MLPLLQVLIHRWRRLRELPVWREQRRVVSGPSWTDSWRLYHWHFYWWLCWEGWGWIEDPGMSANSYNSPRSHVWFSTSARAGTAWAPGPGCSWRSAPLCWDCLCRERNDNSSWWVRRRRRRSSVGGWWFVWGVWMVCLETSLYTGRNWDRWEPCLDSGSRSSNAAAEVSSRGSYLGRVAFLNPEWKQKNLCHDMEWRNQYKYKIIWLHLS